MSRLATLAVAVPLLAALPPPGSAETSEVRPSYIGGEVCKGCHLVQHLSWEQGPHGRAFEALAPGSRESVKRRAGLDPARDYRSDASCLPCHTTGYGEPGGFTSAEQTPDRVHVGCESCHGAGSEFVERVMRVKYSFAHAEVSDLGHIGYVDPAALASAGREGGAEPPGGSRYGYTPLGDPPPYARRYQGEVLPLDPASVRHCTAVCHGERSPTHAVSGVKDLEARFERHVRMGVHRRYGLKFIHW